MITLGLLEKQQVFAVLVSKLIQRAVELGYGVTLGETYRPPETALLYSQQGRGSAKSLHTEKLAIDLNLFRDGRYLTKTEDHRPLGLYWKSLSTELYTCCWGGDFFPKSDANHYSISHLGVK